MREPQVFRTKPALLAIAMQWDGSEASQAAIVTWGGGKIVGFFDTAYFLEIHGPGVKLRVDPGDWVVEIGPGSFIPCKSDQFAESYEPLTSTQPDSTTRLSEGTEDAEAVEAIAEALWNEREFREPTGDEPEGWCPPGHDVHQEPPREPFLWEQMVTEGKYEGDQEETRKDARAVLAALRRLSKDGGEEGLRERLLEERDEWRERYKTSEASRRIATMDWTALRESLEALDQIDWQEVNAAAEEKCPSRDHRPLACAKCVVAAALPFLATTQKPQDEGADDA